MSFTFQGFRPLLNGLDLVRGYVKVIWREDVSEVFHGVMVPFELGAGKQSMLP
jgi:hypothetical protein